LLSSRGVMSSMMIRSTAGVSLTGLSASGVGGPAPAVVPVLRDAEPGLPGQECRCRGLRRGPTERAAGVRGEIPAWRLFGSFGRRIELYGHFAVGREQCVESLEQSRGGAADPDVAVEQQRAVPRAGAWDLVEHRRDDRVAAAAASWTATGERSTPSANTPRREGARGRNPRRAPDRAASGESAGHRSRIVDRTDVSQWWLQVHSEAKLV
jgi:hypothetical protein